MHANGMIAEINNLRKQGETWEMIGELMGKSPAYAFLVARGDRDVSREAMDTWIVQYRKGYAGQKPVQICPTCGEVHAVDDCHGKDGQPVILGDGEKVAIVRPQGARRDTRHRLTVSAKNKKWLTSVGLSADEAIGRLREGKRNG